MSYLANQAEEFEVYSTSHKEPLMNFKQKGSYSQMADLHLRKNTENELDVAETD